MSRIKGITIEFDGETRGLDKALSDVNSRSRDVAKELRQVESLLKFNPGNTELVAQKQKLLADQVENTREKLNRLKDAQAEVQKQFEKGEISEEQYRAFQREIVETESKLKHYEGQLEQTQTKMQQFGEKMGETGEKFKSAGDKMTSAGKDLSKKVTAPLLGVAAAATKVGSDFEAGMSEVGAISGATGDELKKLEEKAREMGATTQFSATESAEALSYMAMAGWDTTEMLDGIDGVMALAAASGEDLATTSDIVTDALTAFGMTAADTGQFADVLAAAASNANTDVSMMGESFKNVAPVAGALGLTAEDTSLALGLMANAGIKGGKAGNALKTILSNLAKPTAAMEAEMTKLGISLTDSEGNMKSLDEIMQDMRVSFAELDEAEKTKAASTIFGKEAMAGALAIINASEEDYNKLAGAINNSEGAAQEMADTMNDNLQGRMKEMKSALEDVAITIYNNLQPALEKMVELVTRAAEWFQNLSPAMQNTIVVIAGVVAAIGPLLIVFGAMASGMGSIMTTGSLLIENWGLISGAGSALMSGLQSTVAVIFSPAGAIVAGIAAVIAIGVLLYKNWDTIKEKASELTEKVVEVWGIMMDWFSELPAKFKEIWTNIKESVVQWVKDMIAKAVEVGTDFIKTITQFFDELPYKMGHWLGETIAKVINWVVDMKNKATEAGSQFISNLINFIKTLPSKVWTWLSDTYNKTSAWANNMWTKAKEAGTNFIHGVINFVQTLPTRVQEWLTNTITRLTTWVSDMGQKGREAGLDLLNKTVSAIAELPGKMAEAGKDVVRGFWNGIQSMGAWIREKVSGFFSGIVDGVKDTLKIFSPSRVFVELGEFTGQGFVEGLDSMSARVAQASQKMAESAILEKKQLSMAGADISGGDSDSGRRGQSRGGDLIQHITIISPDPTSPAENARQFKNVSRQLAREWR